MRASSLLKIPCLTSPALNQVGPLRCLFLVSILVDVLRTTPESLRVLDSARVGASRIVGESRIGGPQSPLLN